MLYVHIKFPAFAGSINARTDQIDKKLKPDHYVKSIPRVWSKKIFLE